jgi:SAM-dependent methyltransferase
MESVKATQSFYDHLAPHYHLIFEDWDLSLRRQGKALDAIIRAERPKSKNILDLACGIGTQAIGLALRGYQVTGEDLSALSVKRAKMEAGKRGLKMKFGQGDMRAAAKRHTGSFDVALACDNAVPHLLSDQAILLAFKQARGCLKPGGLYLLSVRDYAKESKGGEQLRPYGVRETPQGRFTLFQTWKFSGQRYELSFYVIHEAAGKGIKLSVDKTIYYAITVAHLMTLMRQAGFKKVKRWDGNFYQPVITGIAP